MEFKGQRTICILLAALSLTACASKKLQQVTIPEVGQVSSRGLGESLLVHGNGLLKPVLVIAKDQNIGDYALHQGKYTALSENAELIKFGPIQSSAAAGVPVKKANLYLNKNDKTICAGKELCAAIDYTLDSTLTGVKSNSFQQTLIYSGKVGERITLGYREFSNNAARPAFSNSVDYDLSQSKILGYKGARIEVISASNSEIVYKVLSGFE